MENFTDQIEFRKAKKKAREIRSFYINLLCYCIVIPTLIVINLYFTPELHWFYFSMIGWGMGLLFQAISTFGWNPFFGKNWENRKLKQFMDEERQKNNNQF